MTASRHFTHVVLESRIPFHFHMEMHDLGRFWGLSQCSNPCGVALTARKSSQSFTLIVLTWKFKL